MTTTVFPESEQEMAKWFARFAEQASESKMYSYLSQRISQDEPLLRLAAFSQTSQPAPNLFLGAVHFLLLRAEGDELQDYYPSTGGVFEATDAMFAVFKTFCERHHCGIRHVLETRTVQTNEVQRSALLAPALGVVAQWSSNVKLAVLDVGASAGLNLFADQIRIEYSDGCVMGPEAALLKLTCRSEGRFPDLIVPQVVSRIGIDLNPVDLSDPLERDWMLALVWPDQTGRFERLKQAITIFDSNKCRMVKGGGNEVLPEEISNIRSDAAVAVMHSFALNQFSADDRASFETTLLEGSRQRDIFRIALEWIETEGPTLSLFCYRRGSLVRDVKLADCHQHGAWVRWCDAT